MGMASGGATEADVNYNKAAARTQYSGEILQTAKCVSDAAAGGMVLLSEGAYRRLPMMQLWDKAMIMHIGETRPWNGWLTLTLELIRLPYLEQASLFFMTRCHR
jgi:hypothetical protein